VDSASVALSSSHPTSLPYPPPHSLLPSPSIRLSHSICRYLRNYSRIVNWWSVGGVGGCGVGWFGGGGGWGWGGGGWVLKQFVDIVLVWASEPSLPHCPYMCWPLK